MNSITQAAAKIKLLILDVDGVLTNGQIILGANGEELKAFHVHDGQGITLLQSTGVKVALITKRNSAIVARRAQELKIEHVYQGQDNKITAFESLLAHLNLRPDEVAYMGDDLPDLPVLARVGLSTSVKNGMAIVRERVMWVSQYKGGRGAVRELCDLIMGAQDTYRTALKQLGVDS